MSENRTPLATVAQLQTMSDLQSEWQQQHAAEHKALADRVSELERRLDVADELAMGDDA